MRFHALFAWVRGPQELQTLSFIEWDVSIANLFLICDAIVRGSRGGNPRQFFIFRFFKPLNGVWEGEALANLYFGLVKLSYGVRGRETLANFYFSVFKLLYGVREGKTLGPVFFLLEGVFLL